MNNAGGVRRKVVVVGGGFAGLYAAKSLANTEVDVVLVDRKNHHTFQPLLYQVATGVLGPHQIAAPLRAVLRKARNTHVLLQEVTGFDLDRRVVLLSEGELPYDYLIVAAGARHSYFGHDEWAAHAPGLKTLEDAVDIRARVLSAFERAEQAAFVSGEQPILNFAVIGGGPTGVELAGMLADIARRVVADEYHSIDTRKARVLLFEAADRILLVYPPELSASARRQLEELGVEVLTGTPVTAVEEGRIRVGEEWMPTAATIWATGVAASPLGRMLGGETDRAGRVAVAPDLSLPGRPEVFVIGDMASLKDAEGKVVPGLGAAAIQMGRTAASNILHDLQGNARTSFVYRDKGTMATIGKHRAIALIGKHQISGFIAWVLWGIVHVFLLIGFRSRLAVMREWMWAYFTERINGRLITTPGEVSRQPAQANHAAREKR